MVRIYCDPLIAVEVEYDDSDEKPVAKVVAEDSNPTQEITVWFRGAIASEVASKLIPGMRFTFRGMVYKDKVVGVSFSPMA